MSDYNLAFDLDWAFIDAWGLDCCRSDRSETIRGNFVLPIFVVDATPRCNTTSMERALQGNPGDVRRGTPSLLSRESAHGLCGFRPFQDASYAHAAGRADRDQATAAAAFGQQFA